MYIEVEGGGKAAGELTVQGSKNAVLPMIAAAVLCRQTTILENCPKIQDVYSMVAVLRSVGAGVRWEEDKLIINAETVDTGKIIQKEAGELRASVLFLGSMLGRIGEVEICMPGGCSIGARPVDYHLQAFETLGVRSEQRENSIFCKREHHGKQKVHLPYPSVGATENVILFAVCRNEKTVLENVAREPEIIELCNLLRKMGGEISGDGSSRIVIEGGKELHGVTYRLKTDRIAFITYAAMAAATGGSAYLNVFGETFDTEKRYLVCTGCRIDSEPGRVFVSGKEGIRAIPFIRTGPYPEFPTDAQSLFLALLSRAYGESVVEESVFENRFLVAAQLRKMGADIEVAGQRACIRGVTKLHGEQVETTDLRSGAALLLAGTMAEGKTMVTRPELIFRGYETPVENMQSLGLRARYVV